MDPTAINKTLNGQHFILNGTDNNFHHVSGYGHFIQYKNCNHHWSSIYFLTHVLGALHVLFFV